MGSDVMYPVIVFLHGGSYQVGSGNYYDGSVLASNRVVIVIINYRLGPFGEYYGFRARKSVKLTEITNCPKTGPDAHSTISRQFSNLG